SEGSCYCLETCQGYSISSKRGVICVSSHDQRVLCVHHLERRRFSGLITQERQSQAFSGELGHALGAVHGRFGRHGFVVCRVEITEQLTLRLTQRHLRLGLSRMTLAQLASEPSPIPERHRQIRRDEVTEVWEHPEVRLCRDSAMQRELVGFDAVVSVDENRGNERVPR